MLATDLSPYGIKSEDFMKASTASSNLVNLWLGKINNELKDEVLLASILQETGKFILADLILHDGKSELFKGKIAAGKTVEEAEKELLEVTTSQITAKIFRHWKLSDNLINIIENVDDISNAQPEYKKKAQILDVIKTACSVKSPLSDENIEKAVFKAHQYGFDIKIFTKAIETLQDRLLDEL